MNSCYSCILTDFNYKYSNMIKPEPYIGKEAKYHFDRILEHLENADALMDIDSYIISMMAQYLKMYNDAAGAVEKEGSWQVFKNGASNVSGAFSVMEKCMAQFLKFSEKLGMSEKDRERMLKFKRPQVESDALDELL